MKQLAHSTPEAQKGAERGAIRKYAPLVAVIAGSAALMFTPAEGSAQQSRRAQCSASVQTGEMSPLTSKGRSSRLVSQPLLEANKYVSLTLPNSYIDELVRAAMSRPEAERESFVGDAIRRNLEAAISQMGPSKTRVTFQCIPVSTLTAQPQPQPAPQPDSDAGAPAPAPAQPQPATDGGTEEGARRRVIQPGGKSAPVSGPKAEAPAERPSLPQLPKQINGGNGSQKSPYELTPVSKRESGSGMGATKIDVPFILDIEGVGKIHFKAHFSLSQLSRKNQNDTLSEIREIFRSAVYRKAAEGGVPANNTAVRDFARNLPGTFAQVIRTVEKTSGDIADYIGAN